MERVGGLHIVQPFLGFAYEPQRLVLDANVVIDMERWYFRGQGGRDIASDLVALFDRYAAVDPDVVYGFGATEAGWRRGHGLNVMAYQKSLYAASRIIQWDPGELRRRAASSVAPVAGDTHWRNAIARAQPPADVDFGLLMVFVSYASLLYLLRLDRDRRRWRQKGPLWAITDYVEWLAANLDFVGSYEMQIGINLLMGDEARRNGASRLLKLGGSETPDKLAKNCWSTAWDINYLRMSEGETFGLLGESSPAVLVTRDADPGFVRAQAEISEVAHAPTGGPTVGVRLTWLQHPDVVETELAAVLEKHVGRHRRGADIERRVNRMVAATKELEADIGIAPSAFTGTRWS
jgi:hypothetical protein